MIIRSILRTSSILFALLLLASCSDSAVSPVQSDTTGTDTAAQTETPELYTLPEHDFSGEAVNIICTDYPTCASLVAEETGDVLDDAKYHMKRTVEEAFNVTITEDTSTGHWDMNTHLNALIMSGDTTFDIVSMMDRFALTSAMQNLFLPIQDLPELNLNAVYWGDFSDALKINGEQYFSATSSNLVSFRRSACILMNNRLAAEYDLTVPYDAVRDGTWTWDKLMEVRGMATKDLNGDGVFDGNDQFTYDSTDVREYPLQVWVASDLKFLSTDTNGTFVVSVYDNEKFIDVFKRAQELLFAGENDVSFGSSTESNTFGTDLFGKGHALYAFAQLMNLEGTRSMEDDFSILPMPKYDEAQENYRSLTHDLQFFCVPITQEDISLSAAVMDALSCVGYYDLLPVYTETVLKDKFSRDMDSKEMLQLIYDTRTFEASEMYLYDQFGRQFVYTNILEKNLSLVTVLEKQEKRINSRLNDIMEAFE